MEIEKYDVVRLTETFPVIKELIQLTETCWMNPNKQSFQLHKQKMPLTEQDVKDAESRLDRFAPYLQNVFPETKETKGIIESPLIAIPTMKSRLESRFSQQIEGELLLKCDHDLPISGSIKARGGIYEILKYAEDLAIKHNMLSFEDDYRKFDSEKFRLFFQQYTIAVGSTGNLGLSIGIISAKLGFQVTVHMSADAKQWKKDLLRSKGVTVIEYTDDYSKAVEEGRKQSSLDPMCYFVDDENSKHLFLGYAVSAIRLKKQLAAMKVKVDKNHPLFVYLPCGVGGGPGGVAFGLKLMYGDDVRCFFAEPTHAPCMLLGLATNLHDKISVQDIGLDNITEADGLAVGRPSGFVGQVIGPVLEGSYTISDDEMHRLLAELADSEGIELEPSALAGMMGPVMTNRQLSRQTLEHATHIVWATGGSMVPLVIKKEYYEKGKLALRR
ncbi:D-serine ammonia-lyase [Priestia flexa]|uniref:D-serine ammonia-lyase n=1 Tax=Priestia flexa TaxID=86664 RepID=UPI001EF47D2E|nr:D-serine ammonia-lyase [Priestia flexa]MCG7314533.1 D-serine ammonia-lyase [Priestia flexa]